MDAWPQASTCSSITATETLLGDDDMRVHARQQLRSLNGQQAVILIGLTQDCADAVIAAQEVVGARHRAIDATTQAAVPPGRLERAASKPSAARPTRRPEPACARHTCAGKRVTVASRSTIAICGLISACCSIWKAWPRNPHKRKSRKHDCAY